MALPSFFRTFSREVSRIALLGFFVLLSCIGMSVFAAAGSTDMTSTSFTVNLSTLDPLSWAHGSDQSGIQSGKQGIGALKVIIENFTNVLLFSIPILAAISLLIAGYFYIFSAGDSEKASRAKGIIKWNLIAMLIAFFSWSIVKIIASFF